MPVQQQMSSFAKKLGGRVAAANAEHKDKPVDTGNRRLPAGIRDGRAKLSTMYTKEYEDGAMKGQTFFRASAIVESPEEHDGQKVRGLVTSIMVPLCDVPATNFKAAKSFSDNWYAFQNVFKLLGVAPCPETQATDPTGQRTEAYFFAAMKTLTDPVRMRANPIYVTFSTRGFTPKPTVQQSKPTEMVFEEWHGLAKAPAPNDPASGVTVADRPPTVPHTPPTGNEDGLPVTAGPVSVAGVPSPMSGGPTHLSDEVSGLVEVAMSDPNGDTAEGQESGVRLEELAWAAGWTKEQTGVAKDWAAVGEMALGTPPGSPPSLPTASVNETPEPPAPGRKYKFAKRTQDGTKLKNAKGEEFPPTEVEVVSVDQILGTCVVKSCKDGKTVTDLRTKSPVAVKYEWLES